MPMIVSGRGYCVTPGLNLVVGFEGGLLWDGLGLAGRNPCHAFSWCTDGTWEKRKSRAGCPRFPPEAEARTKAC